MIKQHRLYLTALEQPWIQKEMQERFDFFTGDVRYLVSPQAGIKGWEIPWETVFCIFSFLFFSVERKGLLGYYLRLSADILCPHFPL